MDKNASRQGLKDINVKKTIMKNFLLIFDNTIIEVAQKLANEGTMVIVAGLDMDFMGRPFGPMPDFFAIAEYITKVHAICMECGELAQFSHRLLSRKRLYCSAKKIFINLFVENALTKNRLKIFLKLYQSEINLFQNF